MDLVRRIAGLFSLVLLGLVLSVSLATAQDRSSRTLFEFLFGGENEQAQPAPQPAPQPQPQPQPQPRTPQPAPSPAPAPAPAPEPEPEPDTAEKAEEAQRVAVFGDSLGVDLALALERLYADNTDIRIIEEAVGSSGFVRDDFFDWNAAIRDEIAADSFDVAVVAIGINDRQALNGADPLSDAWREAYEERIEDFLDALNAAGKDVVWIELPPMQQSGYGAAMAQISSIHKAAVAAAGGEWVETYERYLGEDGTYSAAGPDLNGNIATMRKSDGIHFSSQGADKLAFYVDRALASGSGGTRVSLSGSTVEVSDLLAGTDAESMLRPPFQGLEQMRLVEMASIIQDLGTTAQRANDLIVSGAQTAGTQSFELSDMLAPPPGRIDAFGAAPTIIENPTGR